MSPVDWHINYRHLRAGVVVDTNLLLLMLVGRYDPKKLPAFRSTQKYSIRILEILEDLASLFRKIYATSNILTEVDNLSRQVAKAEWNGIGTALQTFAQETTEVQFPSNQLLAHEAHRGIGVTDCSILELATKDILVVTDDLRLTAQLERRRLGVINLSRYVGI